MPLLTWAHHGGALLCKIAVVVTLLAMAQGIGAQTCGAAVNNTSCQDGLCCSKFGYCGASVEYCGAGCQSQCESPPPAGPPVPSTSGLDKTINASLFDALFPNRNKFYTYNAFITAGNRFPQFGTEGDEECRLREIAAFAAHVQQETAGLVYIHEIDQSFNYCDATNVEYPCAANKSYSGRGPLQLSWNYNYGAASASVGVDILADPEKVAMDPALAFEGSLWFWTQTSGSIPSIHNVLTGKYRPTRRDLKLHRYPGFGLTILIINGGIECGKVTPQATNRITYFKQFAAQLGVNPGWFLTCNKMTPYS